MKIIFAGTPAFAVPTLQALLQSSHELIAVFTQPDRPAGRGQQLQASPVKQLAQSHHIPVFQPKTLRDEPIQNTIKSLQADVMVVVAYGLLLPEAVLQTPRFGCVNIHPSLLPRWRGAAPIQRSLEAGDAETGVTIMRMDKGMDTGPILKQEKYSVKGNETSSDMHDMFSERGAVLLLETLNGLETNAITPIAQNNLLATHAAKIEKGEAVIDWQQASAKIYQKIRAFHPWPVANTLFQNEVLKVWEAKIISTEKTKYKSGVFVAFDQDAICIATGDGVLGVTALQLPGKKMVSAVDFMHGHGKNLISGKTIFGK